MAGLQTAARRLLTEAAAALLYVPLSQRGAANGVATLGADSRLPIAQAPANLVPVAAVQLASLFSSTSTTAVDAPLALSLAAGTHLVTFAVQTNGGSTTPAARVGLRMASGAATGTLTGTAVLTVGATPAMGGTNAQINTVTGIVTVTTAGTLTATLIVGTGSGTVSMSAGALLSAQRMA